MKENEKTEVFENLEDESVETTEKEVGKTKFNLSQFTTGDKIKLLLYIVFLVYSLIVQFAIQPSFEVVLGDFGTIFVVLLNVIGVVGFRWLPILSVVGIVLLLFKKYFLEISKAYFIIVAFLTVVSTYFVFNI